MANSYPIGTLRDMAAIPEDALPRFLAELPTILREARGFFDMQEKFNAEFGDIGQMQAGVPSWVDDDLDQMTARFTVDGEDEPFATTTVKRRV